MYTYIFVQVAYKRTQTPIREQEILLDFTVILRGVGDMNAFLTLDMCYG